MHRNVSLSRVRICATISELMLLGVVGCSGKSDFRTSKDQVNEIASPGSTPTAKVETKPMQEDRGSQDQTEAVPVPESAVSSELDSKSASAILEKSDLKSDLSSGTKGPPPLCVASSDKTEFRFAIPWSSEPVDPRNNWIKESDIFELDISNSQGEAWPVSDFKVDDLAFMLKPDESIQLQTDRDPGAVTFTLPEQAFAIADNTLYGQSGWLSPGADIRHEKVYRQTGRDNWSVLVPSRVPTFLYLNDLKVQGLPVVALKDISKNLLRERGLLDSQGILRFKMATIVHGSGDLSIRFDFSCPSSE
jgi:hypothetical protein